MKDNEYRISHRGSLARRLLEEKTIEGRLEPGKEIGLKIDQVLTQDATGTMVYLEFESLGLDRVAPEVAVSYVDHNIVQADFKNADDHRFLQSCAARYGVRFSPPGNGVSHHVHRQRFGVPGKSLLGSDSHTTTGGCLGMLAMGAGGVEVAMALAGRPYYIKMPEIWGCRLEGELPPWVVGKDVILHLLREYSVKGGVGKVMEFYGPGVAGLDMADRAMIANMAVDMGLTAAVFPSDGVTREYLRRNGRETDWTELGAGPGGDPEEIFDEHTVVDLSALVPLVACPHSPDNVVPASELSDVELDQVIIGSSASGGYRDFMRAAGILAGKVKHPGVDFDINPASRQDLENVMEMGGLKNLIDAGARICEAGCLGCIGMGQAPSSGSASLRTFPRNYKGRSGTVDARVYLASAETAAASVLTGRITDPRSLSVHPYVTFPEIFTYNPGWIIDPPDDGSTVEILRGPNIKELPRFEPLPDDLDVEIVLKVGDNITIDHIMPAGTRVLPYRSNTEELSRFVFDVVDPEFPKRAKKAKEGAVVGGVNYGQGSSREQAALVPRYLGIRIKLTKSFARIHKANLVNFGILPLTFIDPADYGRLEQGGRLRFRDLRKLVESGAEKITVEADGRSFKVILDATPRQRKILLAGGILNTV
ncbi:MAG: aconitate hydratase [bacterium]